jgi:putative addiction module killer protein
MIEIVEYVRTNGRCPFAEWFAKLNKEAAAKVSIVLERMAAGNFGDHKAVGQGVSERRINFGPGYRLYFGREGNTLVVLVGGGSKSRQEADIKAAQEAWAEYQATKRRNG